MYGKLFASLYQGTLRGRADEILVFTNLIAHADQFGVIDNHWRTISEETGISRERVETAIANLEAPDPESRSPEEDGRRIVRLDEHRAWGWRIVNHGKYRAIRNEDDRRTQNREAQKRYRERHGSKPRKPRSAHTEADTDTEANTRVERGAAGAPRPSLPATQVPVDIAEAARARGRANRSRQIPEDFAPDQEHLAMLRTARPDLTDAMIDIETVKFKAQCASGRSPSFNFQKAWLKWVVGTRTVGTANRAAGGGSEPAWKGERRSEVQRAIVASKGTKA